MSESVTAIYENGVLRPLRKLNLRERQTVEVYITTSEDTSPSESDRVLRALAASGAVTPADPTSAVPPISEQRREELARIFSTGKSVSELILEIRREGW